MVVCIVFLLILQNEEIISTNIEETLEDIGLVEALMEVPYEVYLF